jgi:hypothetical protein
LSSGDRAADADEDHVEPYSDPAQTH